MLQPGHSVGNYRIDRVLGDGGMAVVYASTHTVFGTTHALKVLLDNYAMRSNVVARFRREARLQAQLSHPNIVKVTDFIETPEVVALAMELIDGQALDEWVSARANGPALPWREAIDLLRPVVDAVAFAHEHGVVHRDLKPANVLVAQGPGGVLELKVTDFGIAKVQDEAGQLTGTNSRMGTWGYMAPEQFRGAKDVDARADVFSLGMMLWELVAGRLLVDLDDQLAVMQLYARQLQVPRLDAAGVGPGWLADVVAQCLCVGLQERFLHAEALLGALERGGEAADGATQQAITLIHKEISTHLFVAPPMR